MLISEESSLGQRLAQFHAQRFREANLMTSKKTALSSIVFVPLQEELTVLRYTRRDPHLPVTQNMLQL